MEAVQREANSQVGRGWKEVSSGEQGILTLRELWFPIKD